MHEAKCPLCGQTDMLSAWDDWNWPKSKKLNERAKLTREF